MIKGITAESYFSSYPHDLALSLQTAPNKLLPPKKTLLKCGDYWKGEAATNWIANSRVLRRKNQATGINVKSYRKITLFPVIKHSRQDLILESFS